MTRLRFPLRAKFFLFAVLLAVGPLILVAQNISRLTRDELKSAANEDLTSVAAELRTSFDNTFQGRWLTPLMVIRNGVDSPDLDVAQKVSLLTLGLQELPQVAALQLSVAGSDLPILVTNSKYSGRVIAAGLDPVRFHGSDHQASVAILLSSGTERVSQHLWFGTQHTGVVVVARLAQPRSATCNAAMEVGAVPRGRRSDRTAAFLLFTQPDGICNGLHAFLFQRDFYDRAGGAVAGRTGWLGTVVGCSGRVLRSDLDHASWIGGVQPGGSGTGWGRVLLCTERGVVAAGG